MDMIEVTNEDLNEICQWYKQRFGQNEVCESVFITYLCGRCHTYPKQARGLLSRLKGLGLIYQKRKIIYLK